MFTCIGTDEVDFNEVLIIVRIKMKMLSVCSIKAHDDKAIFHRRDDCN